MPVMKTHLNSDTLQAPLLFDITIFAVLLLLLLIISDELKLQIEVSVFENGSKDGFSYFVLLFHVKN